ncbi:MAG: diphosphomevalonate decarboxylase [Bifidobacterium sp.]|jgi:diphosphomevalonate decarboxylase|nr:diphosphomevalonate decarboxylase [Bifidobacterium sp.]MCH4174870.1 diphosphomevalonate decarboxylase [Bifidobacterium sp.]
MTTQDSINVPSAGESNSAIATANANIALIKYWGKADEDLIIPNMSSLSLTLEGLETTTRVSFDTASHSEQTDLLYIDGKQQQGNALRRVSALLDTIRSMAGIHSHAVVTSHNTVPYEAGLASSSSAFAALATAASYAAGLRLTRRELSRLARRGSGSASRSIFGGMALWHAGHDDDSSFAEPVPCPMDLAIVVVLISGSSKKISSREAMQRSVTTSALYNAWVESNAKDLHDALDAIKREDIAALGSVVQTNSLGMHATMMTAKPPVLYWLPGSVAAMQAVEDLHSHGMNAWATMDAGPNVKVLTTAAEAAQVEQALRDKLPGFEVHTHVAGPGARLLPAEHDI